MKYFFFRRLLLQNRSGTTMIELVLFLSFFAITAGIFAGILVSTSETRIRQQTTSKVDHSGTRLLQTTTRLIRRGERILYPPRGESGSVLVLQMGSESENPTLFTVLTGALLTIKLESGSILSPTDLTVSDFSVFNTSVSDTRGSLYLTFTVSKTVAETFFTHERTFESAVTLFPDDLTQGNTCSCSAPLCTAGELHWNICEGDQCRVATKTVSCN